ncbi:MAG: collagen binding domain-containing protein [Lachnospiraceae bacterium]
MKITHYDYNTILKALPSKYQKKEYIYTVDSVPFISFATYNSSDYKTSIKQSIDTGSLLYCMDFSKHIAFDKNFGEKNGIFSDELRARLGVAMYLGTTEWGSKASAKFTTGNYVLDYYMTQMVIHALIYKYGGDKSAYGINYELITYKSDTGTLSKKTEELYNYCCNVNITLKNGNFQAVHFSFKQMDSDWLLLDGDNLVSPTIGCNVSSENAVVTEYLRMAEVHNSNDELVNCTIESAADQYDSDFNVKLSSSSVDSFEPGVYVVDVLERMNFNRQIAGFWKCSDSGFENSFQELGGLLYRDSLQEDSCKLRILIGKADLIKRDSITGDIIDDAVFQILQFDDTIGDYVYYKNMVYDANSQRYTSGNLYININNKSGKFKIIEASAGENYINDWNGQEFQISENQYLYEFEAENQPILGKLHIYKEGEQIAFTKDGFQPTNQTVPLSNIKFALYAKKDIYLKDNVFYKKDQKIADLITDDRGEVHVDNLLMGSYYLKENQTSNLHLLNSETFDFSITKDNNGKYNEVTYSLVNTLKKCQIQIFKYYPDARNTAEVKKTPIKDCKFGLYAGEDIQDALGNIIVKKDTLIEEAYTDEDGNITYTDLVYGEYYLKELEVPEGYIIDDGVITIKKEDFTLSEEDSSRYLAFKEIVNSKKKYKVKLTKYGEVFSGCTKEINENGAYFIYQYDKAPLDKVTFSIYDEENHLVASQTTDSNGVALFEHMEYGSYYCIEDSCPDNYIKIFEKKDIICKTEDKMTISEWKEPLIEETFYNELCECTLTISKLGEKMQVGKKGIYYDNVPLEGIVYGIYQGFDYTFSSGEQLLTDSCIGYLVTDQSGMAEYHGKLPIGNYYLKELKTKPGYEIDEQKYPFEVKANQNQSIQIDLTEQPFVNYLSKAAVKIIKTDANTGKALKNVEFTLYNQNKQKICVYKTDRKGEIQVENLPYGDYYFVETKCRDGYYSTNNKYKFKLESKDTVVLNITNTPILKLGFEEHYKAGLIAVFFTLLASILICIWNIRKEEKFV